MDEERIMSILKELDRYTEELEVIKPEEIEEYISSIKDRRACERTLQISIESIIDICNIIFSELSLGMPADEDDVVKKLAIRGVISARMKDILSNMKGMRNILVHKYGEIKDEIVFEAISERLGDFEKFKEEILNFLKSKNKKENKK
ncbi:MAG: DUF86 domain-containing protein [Nanoarchaeota archaeon]|nr:DUF86 domain-containing protein [Nanoarchaeota archaeon]